MLTGERQLQIAFRGARVPVYDKETRKASQVLVPIAVEVFYPPGKYTPTGSVVGANKCVRKGHRPKNAEGVCSRCGT